MKELLDCGNSVHGGCIKNTADYGEGRTTTVGQRAKQYTEKDNSYVKFPFYVLIVITFETLIYRLIEEPLEKWFGRERN